MADAALFIGWGQVVRGREKRAVQVFNESVEYWGGLQGDGKNAGPLKKDPFRNISISYFDEQSENGALHTAFSSCPK